MRKKEIIELSVTSFLAIVLLFAVARAVGKAQKAQAAKARRPAVAGRALSIDQGAEDSKGLYRILQEETRVLELKRDPFSPAPVESGITATYLRGVLWSADRPMAIIGDAIVAVGDTVDKKTVVVIKKNEVVLNDGTKDIVLLLE